MEFIINQRILEKYPAVKIGVLIAEGIRNPNAHEEFNTLTLSLQEEIRKKLSLMTLADHPKIKDWRDAYTKFGAKPKTYKNSVEALLRRILSGEKLPSINSVVDSYNFISVKHMLPAGGDDLDRVEGNITLTFSDGSKKFTLLGSTKPENIPVGEVVYSDDKEILCSKWNWRESDKSKMTPATKNICLVIEGLGATSNEELNEALNELKEVIGKYCGGNLRTYILDHTNARVQIR